MALGFYFDVSAGARRKSSPSDWLSLLNSQCGPDFADLRRQVLVGNYTVLFYLGGNIIQLSQFLINQVLVATTDSDSKVKDLIMNKVMRFKDPLLFRCKKVTAQNSPLLVPSKFV